MAIDFPITFSLAPIPSGQSLDANQYGQLLVANLKAFIAGDFLTGQIGGTPPTTNIGVWFNNGVWYYWDPNTNSYIPQTLTSSFPTGAILDFAGTIAPVGFVLCNGALYLRTGSMANLFAVIGTTYGAGDGFSTFAVPDCRGRAAVGAGAGPGLTSRALGSAFGVETQALAVSDLAVHTHAMSHTHTMGNHTHLGADHLHSMQGHTHLGPNHQHIFVGIDHNHPIPTGQFSHTHGFSQGSVTAMIAPTVGLQTGGSSFATPSIITIANATLPAGTTGAADRSLTGTTSGSTTDLTTGGPSVASTGAADRGLTTGGPSTNLSDISNITNVGGAGSGTAHNNMSPAVALNKIIKT